MKKLVDDDGNADQDSGAADLEIQQNGTLLNPLFNLNGIDEHNMAAGGRSLEAGTARLKPSVSFAPALDPRGTTAGVPEGTLLEF